MKRFWCRLFGHRWEAYLLGFFGGMADLYVGPYAQCERCGAKVKLREEKIVDPE